MTSMFVPPGRGEYSRWARSLRADFQGRAACGLHFCLLTWRDPIGTAPLWAVGYAGDSVEARENAERELVQQRARLEITSVLADFL